MPTDDIRQFDQLATALGLCLNKRVEISKMRIGQGFIAQRPQALAGLQFGRIGRQEQQMQTSGHDHFVADMPAGLIDDQHNLFVWPTTDRGCDFGQGRTPQIGGDRGQQQPEGLPTLWADKALQIRPFVAMLHRDNRSLTFLTPDPA
jgi:hypothetical protein